MTLAQLSEELAAATGLAGLTKDERAELLGISPDLVYVALRIARKNGWLTSLGTGNSGGVLTELGLKRFKEIDGEALLKKHLTE